MEVFWADLTDKSAALLAQVRASVTTALTAMGTKGVELVLEKMAHGYSDPHPDRNMKGAKTGGMHTSIYYTGDLMRSISSSVDADGLSVEFGTNIQYATFVHEDTRKLKGRPCLKNAIEDSVSELADIAQAYHANGV